MEMRKRGDCYLTDYVELNDVSGYYCDCFPLGR